MEGLAKMLAIHVQMHCLNASTGLDIITVAVRLMVTNMRIPAHLASEESHNVARVRVVVFRALLLVSNVVNGGRRHRHTVIIPQQQ